MTSSLQRLKADKQPIICGVCRRAAVGLGYTPRFGAPILWLCDDTGCLKVGRSVYFMPTERLNAFEVGAAREAVDVAGPYLDSVGKTDLAQLTLPEADEFFRRFLVAFEQSMRRKLVENEPPF